MTRRSVVGVGVFDGLHRGHQRVLAMVTDLARDAGALSVAATFDPHPAEVLDPAGAPRLIGTIDQRLEGFDALGVDLARVLTFDDALAAESAEAFVERVLVAELRAAVVVVGEDFRFGHERHGDVALLERLGASHDFRVAPAPAFGDAERWSSTLVRRRLMAGDVEGAADVLGRPFVLRAVVERGDARGRELGYPTANLATAPRQALPAAGIYAGAARSPDGEWWPAATSVGTRPQFYEDGALLVEAFLPGFSGDLYDANVDLAFLARIRDEAVFADVAALTERIGADVEATLARFKEFSPGGSPLLGW
ncbi:MAG: riboflavin biosynthesis protein RibF [Acidobacteriota bacterium]|nr:riboflavin biosynthesis protein RibF [Acidobacteriota bacterium]